MRRLCWLCIFLLVTGCRAGSPDNGFYRDVGFGKSAAEVRALVPDHYASVVGDQQAGDYRLMLVVMNGREMAGNHLHTGIRLVFYRDKMVAFGIEYFVLAHHPEAKLDRDQCDAIFTIAVGDVASVYGQPDHRQGDPASKDDRVIWKWFPDGRFITVVQGFGAGRCEVVAAVAYDGSEADFKKFSKLPDGAVLPSPDL